MYRLLQRCGRNLQGTILENAAVTSTENSLDAILHKSFSTLLSQFPSHFIYQMIHEDLKHLYEQLYYTLIWLLMKLSILEELIRQLTYWESFTLKKWKSKHHKPEKLGMILVHLVDQKVSVVCLEDVYFLGKRSSILVFCFHFSLPLVVGFSCHKTFSETHLQNIR